MRLTFITVQIFSVLLGTVNKTMGNSNVGKFASSTPDLVRPATFKRLPALRMSLVAAGVAATLLLAGCNERKAAQSNAPAVKTEVSAMTLHPQSIAITAELPGRTSAYLVAEVRPQVGGIIRSRNFKEGSEVNAGDVLYRNRPGFLSRPPMTAPRPPCRRRRARCRARRPSSTATRA